MIKMKFVKLVSGAALIGALGLGMAPLAFAQSDTARTYPTTADRDDGPDMGWVGLLGLAGLAGLMRREKPHATTAGYKAATTQP